MTKKNHSVKQMAGMIGCSREALSKYLNSRSDISSENFVKILDHLGIKLDKELVVRISDKKETIYSGQNINEHFQYVLSCLGETERRTILKTLMKIGLERQEITQDENLRMSLNHLKSVASGE